MINIILYVFLRSVCMQALDSHVKLLPLFQREFLDLSSKKIINFYLNISTSLRIIFLDNNFYFFVSYIMMFHGRKLSGQVTIFIFSLVSYIIIFHGR